MSSALPTIRNPKPGIRNHRSEIIDSEINYDELLEPIEYHFNFELDRRSFVQVLGAGVLVTIVAGPALAQQRRGGGGGGGFLGGPPATVAARIHVADDGTLTVLCGKVDGGQGARCEVAMAAAEELRVPVERMQVILSDTGLTPNDGMTAGSGTTPRTIPSVRQGAAAFRQLCIEQAAKQWGVEPTTVEVADGKVTEPSSRRSFSYSELAKNEDVIKQLAAQPPDSSRLTNVAQWKVLGTPQFAPTAREKITGAHKYPTDIKRPGMLYGAMLRSPTYKGKLVSVDDWGLKNIDKEVIVVQDGDFVGVVAPTSFRAQQAIRLLSAKWDNSSIPSSKELFDYLREHADAAALVNPYADDVKDAPKSLKQEYYVPYVQHAPLEPRAALAEWADGKLTVWTGSQNPFGVKGELQQAFKLGDDAVRVIVPDFGSGYGGKHTGEFAIEAARLAKQAGKPVMLRWTREEEFTWAYFRPAGVLLAEASLDSDNKLATWHFINISSGPSSVEMPYKVPKKNAKFVRSQPPLREGSYRALAATANNFARESFMDELADAAGTDPLEFRLANLENPRMRAVLEEAAKQFDWPGKSAATKQPNRGIGLACGTDKGSFVAACVEIEIDADTKEIAVRHVCEAFECGKIVNPENLRNQIEGAVTMGLGPALREAMEFDADGTIQNASFRQYRVPHFSDIPTIDVHLLDRPDLASAGAGETPIIAVAPAIANAVVHATGRRIREMPIQLA
jgi:isoquinoline 1-oxidoreductase subunit beta